MIASEKRKVMPDMGWVRPKRVGWWVSGSNPNLSRLGVTDQYFPGLAKYGFIIVSAPCQARITQPGGDTVMIV